MKKLLVVLLAVLVITGCGIIPNIPDVAGKWIVNASPGGVPESYEIELVVDELKITDNNLNIVEGYITITSRIAFVRFGNSYFGEVNGNTMSGFIRLGKFGDIIGYWSATIVE